MHSTITFEHVNPVDDGGHLAAELVLKAGEFVGLVDDGRIKIGNARPDHDIVTLKSGKERYRNTSKRQKEWTDRLLRNEAILGNLTLNLNPDECDYHFDEREHTLEVYEGVFDQGVDSATRSRAVIEAAKSPVQTFDLETRIAFRVTFLTEEQERRFFHHYNQVGEKVNDTVAKFVYQSNPGQAIARELMLASTHLGLDNIEVQRNTVSASSPKIAAFNTLSTAVENSWMHEPIGDVGIKEDAAYLADFWNALVQVRPEFGRLNLAERRDLRNTSVAGTALAIHGVIAVADAFYHSPDPEDFSRLSALKSSVIAEVDGKDEAVDYFSQANPVWTRNGVLVSSVAKDGTVRLNLRSSFQTRKAMADELKAKIGL